MTEKDLRDTDPQEMLRALNTKIDKGLASLKAGRSIDGRVVYDDLLKLRSSLPKK